MLVWVEKAHSFFGTILSIWTKRVHCAFRVCTHRVCVFCCSIDDPLLFAGAVCEKTASVTTGSADESQSYTLVFLSSRFSPVFIFEIGALFERAFVIGAKVGGAWLSGGRVEKVDCHGGRRP